MTCHHGQISKFQNFLQNLQIVCTTSVLPGMSPYCLECFHIALKVSLLSGMFPNFLISRQFEKFPDKLKKFWTI